jgi:hypothetical protein
LDWNDRLMPITPAASTPPPNEVMFPSLRTRVHVPALTGAQFDQAALNEAVVCVDGLRFSACRWRRNEARSGAMWPRALESATGTGD